MKSPREPFVSTLPGHPPVTLGPSDRLRDDNPHVLARPDFFVDVEPNFRGIYGNEVEEATARPGELRNK